MQIFLILILAFSSSVFAGEQIGDVNGRTYLSQESYRSLSATERSAIRSTVVLYSDEAVGTGVYLGSIGDDGYVLTVSHVAEMSMTEGAFQIQGAEFIVREIVADFPDIDAAVLKIGFRKSAQSLISMKDAAKLGSSPAAGEDLIATGFAHSFARSDPNSYLMSFNHDSDCRVYYESNDQIRLKTDLPTPIYGPAYTGCESAHGDSGGPSYDRMTGELVGITSQSGLKNEKWRKSSASLKEHFLGSTYSAVNVAGISGILTGIIPINVIRQKVLFLPGNEELRSFFEVQYP